MSLSRPVALPVPTLRHRSVLLLACAVAAIGAVTVAPTAQAEAERYTYVAGPGTGQPNLVVFGLPWGSISSEGEFDFRAQGTSFRLMVDDLGVPDGRTVPVRVRRSEKGPWTEMCLPVRTEVRFGQIARGARVTFAVMGDGLGMGAYPYLGCTGRATAGSAAVKQ